MSMKTPRGYRLHIGLFGRRNVGKSSLLNAVTRQAVSIVSDVAGTTTDPVEKPMELLPIGPVVFIDTAGIDDAGALGEERIARTRKAFERSDIGLLVTAAGTWGRFEEGILSELAALEIPVIVIFNQRDLGTPEPGLLARLEREAIAVVETVAPQGAGILELRDALVRTVPEEFINLPSILGDLVPPGEAAVLVCPIDKEAPKGRLILPQVQTIRDLLDHRAWCLVVTEHELAEALGRLRRPPALVVTDSQAFAEVARATPAEVPLTSFSILFARFKGDLSEMVRATLAIEDLRPGDAVLVAEACSHHPIEDDIGRVKIPRWLEQHVGGALSFTQVQGRDFPDDLSGHRLIVHCGACMWNRRQMLTRMLLARRAGVPLTNYGLTIAYALGIFERALGPFPEALAIHRSSRPPARAG